MTIGKVIPNPSADGNYSSRVQGLVDYITSPENTHRDEKCLYSGAVGFLSDTADGRKAEMTALCYSAKRKSKDPVMHIVISFHEHEEPSKEQVDEAVQIMLKELGLEGHQCVYGLHRDTDNSHIHLAINRTSPVTERVIEVNKGFTHEAVLRGVARIEHKQCWEREQNGRYIVDEQDHIQFASMLREQGPKVGTKAKDNERRTGEKSAQRIGIEALPGILSSAQDWQQFYQLLAAAGMEYERKGSGALIHVHVGDEVQHLKASQASRAASLSALVKKFGDYESAPDYKVKTREPEPTRPDAPQWAEYRQQREQYYQSNAGNKDKIQSVIIAERIALREKQRHERKEALGGNWRGHGTELNLMRSVLAAGHAKQKAELDERIEQIREQQRKRREHFPDYQHWLEQQGLLVEAHAWRYQDRENAAIGSEQTPAIPHDIRSMNHVIDGNTVRYQRDNDTKFIDYGQRITFEKTDADSVLAGLQLSQQKWPRGFVVTGSDEYLQQCAKLAIEYNFKITNIDYLIEKERTRVQHEREQAMAAQMQQNHDHPAYEQFQRMHLGLQADEYKVQVRDPVSDVGGSVGRGMGFPEQLSKDGRPIPLIPPDKVIDTILTTEHKVTGQEKWSPIIRPVSKDKTYILVDDLDADKLQALKSAGFRPAYVQETSQGNMQATLIVPKIEDRKIANAVATQIKSDLGGDAACNGADHTMRIAGFDNAKAKHRQLDGSYPVVKVIEAGGELCPRASAIADQLTKSAQVRVEHEKTPRPDVTPRPAQNLQGSEIGYVWNRLAEKQVSKAIPGPWKSEQDWLMALALRQCGYGKEQVTDALITLSPKYDRGTSDASWREKQEHTAEKAFSKFGTEQLAKYDKYHTGWIKDRDSALVIRDRDMKRIERERVVAALRKESSKWDGNAAFGPIMYIDNDKAFIKSKRGLYEVPHSIEYKNRPKVGEAVMLTKGKDGGIVLKVKNQEHGHGIGG